MVFNTGMLLAPAPGGRPSQITLSGGAAGSYIDVATSVSATVNIQLIGTSGVVKAGDGELILAGTNSYTGATKVLEGTLTTTSDGAIPGDIAITPAGAGTAVWNWRVAPGSGGSSTFGGTITGDGVFNKQSARELELTGRSAGFMGTTNVTDGKLTVNTGASLMGTINVQNGATIAGTGNFGDVKLLSGGRFIVGGGTASGTTAVTSLETDSGSAMTIALSYSVGTSMLSASQITSSGALTINGGAIAVSLQGGDALAAGSQATIASFPSFSDLTVNGGGWTPPPGNLLLKYEIEYPTTSLHPTEIVLKVEPGTVFESCPFGENACAVVDQFGSMENTDPLKMQVLSAQDSEAVDILGQLSGDVYASVSGAMVNSSRYVRDATGGQTRAAMGGIATPNDISTVSNYAAEASVQTPFGAFEETNSGIDVWFTGYGSWSTIDGDGNAATIKDTAGGMFIGADAAVGANMRLGAMVGYGQSSYEIDARDASGSSNDFTLGLYGGGAWNGFVADFGAAYTWHDVSLERQLNFSTFADTLQGDYDAGTFQVYGGVGYTFDITDNFQVEPCADAAYIHQQSGDFTEAGGLSALSHLDSEMNTWFTTVGVRAAFDFKLGQADSRITASAGWRHGFGDLNPAEQVRFTGGDFFNVAGAPLAEDQAVLSAGWETQINEMISVGISYSAQFGDGNKSQNVTGQLNIRF